MNEPTDRQRAAEAEMRKLIASQVKATGEANIINMVLGSDDWRKAVDKWIKQKQQNDPSFADRIEAIRRLVDLGLKAKGK